jgi:NAD(P)-dependent dehydrogenase (short-subunit alcohol dehydrogenase family)
LSDKPHDPASHREKEEEKIMKSVVVTGVSTGIGRALARRLASRGMHVFGSVRRDKDAQDLRSEFGSACTPLIFDVVDGPAIQRAAEQVRRALNGATLSGLVNNAGIAVGGPLLHMPIELFREQMDVNVAGVLQTTQAFAPLLRAPQAQKSGRLVIMGSVSGKYALPFMGGYCASKFALEGFADTLRRELKLFGIDVVLIEPGAVKTPIWGKGRGDMAVYQTEYGPSLKKFGEQVAKLVDAGLSPDAVADIVIRALETPRPKARYAMPNNVISGWLLPRFLPTRWFDGLVAGQLGLKPVAGGHDG